MYIYASKSILFLKLWNTDQETAAAPHDVVGGVWQCPHPVRLRHDGVHLQPAPLGPIPPPPVQCFCPRHSPHYAPAGGGTSYSHHTLDADQFMEK